MKNFKYLGEKLEFITFLFFFNCKPDNTNFQVLVHVVKCYLSLSGKNTLMILRTIVLNRQDISREVRKSYNEELYNFYSLQTKIRWSVHVVCMGR